MLGKTDHSCHNHSVIGLVLGRFVPPHAGHVQLVNTALGRCERVYLVVCSMKADRIAAQARLFWISQLFAQEIALHMLVVIHIDRELPAAEKNKPHAPEIWAGAVTEHIPEHIDLVYASESYGTEFAHALGARCVQFDPSRPVVPVAASQILADPARYWAFIPFNVRPYFALPLHRTQPSARFTSWIQLPTPDLADYFAKTHGIPILDDTTAPDMFARNPLFVTGFAFDQLVTKARELDAGIVYTAVSYPWVRTRKCLSTAAKEKNADSPAQGSDLSTSSTYKKTLSSYVTDLLRDIYAISWKG